MFDYYKKCSYENGTSEIKPTVESQLRGNPNWDHLGCGKCYKEYKINVKTDLFQPKLLNMMIYLFIIYNDYCT